MGITESGSLPVLVKSVRREGKGLDKYRSVSKNFRTLEKVIDTIKINDGEYEQITADWSNNYQKSIEYLKGERYFFLNKVFVDCFCKVYCQFDGSQIRLLVKGENIENDEWFGLATVNLDGSYVECFVIKGLGIVRKDDMGNAFGDYENFVKMAVDFSLSAWMFFSEYKSTEIVKVTEVKNSHGSKSNKKSKKKKSVVRLTKKIYQVDQEKMPKKTQHDTSYKRHIESWTVKGHWRTTKTGKEVWVKPHKKGSGAITQKIYKI